VKQKIGIIGYGNVGKSLVNQCRALPGFEVVTIAVKHPKKHTSLGKNLLTGDALEIINNPEIDVILEAIDREEDALEYAQTALQLGKTYISANKKMLASHLPKLLRLEKVHGGQLLFEAAVGGAIPIIRVLSTHLRGQEITRIRGILNGTCNYILSQMTARSISFEKALADAQKLGFAEAQPTSDIDGHDAYYKSYLLASIIEGQQPDVSRMKVEGIRTITQADILDAKKRSQKIKLVAEIERREGKLTIDIRPRILNDQDSLYHIENETNAVEIEGPNFQKLTLIGPGAGGKPTASAMVSDLINAQQPQVAKIKQLILALP